MCPNLQAFRPIKSQTYLNTHHICIHPLCKIGILCQFFLWCYSCSMWGNISSPGLQYSWLGSWCVLILDSSCSRGISLSLVGVLICKNWPTYTITPNLSRYLHLRDSYYKLQEWITIWYLSCLFGHYNFDFWLHRNKFTAKSIFFFFFFACPGIPSYSQSGHWELRS